MFVRVSMTNVAAVASVGAVVALKCTLLTVIFAFACACVRACTCDCVRACVSNVMGYLCYSTVYTSICGSMFTYTHSCTPRISVLFAQCPSFMRVLSTRPFDASRSCNRADCSTRSDVVADADAGVVVPLATRTPNRVQIMRCVVERWARLLL